MQYSPSHRIPHQRRIAGKTRFVALSFLVGALLAGCVARETLVLNTDRRLADEKGYLAKMKTRIIPITNLGVQHTNPGSYCKGVRNVARVDLLRVHFILFEQYRLNIYCYAPTKEKKARGKKRKKS